ncbi:cellulose binding domain-containing protein [Kitasatospora sp. NPDC096147]|uniref:cellulose binding domain-containing protein n=1 Tax=Kitasatospora sp. NPDC096147 TaxID=3364093 RepID=UPI0037F7837D
MKSSTWSSGYGMDVFVKNNCAATRQGWTVEFDLPAGTTVSSSWSSVRVQSGQHLTFTPVGWNASVAPGAEQGFGFNAAGTGQPTALTVR